MASLRFTTSASRRDGLISSQERVLKTQTNALGPIVKQCHIA